MIYAIESGSEGISVMFPPENNEMGKISGLFSKYMNRGIYAMLKSASKNIRTCCAV